MSATVRELLRSDLARIGMTQGQFGERLGISQQAISQWYKRKRPTRALFFCPQVQQKTTSRGL